MRPRPCRSVPGAGGRDDEDEAGEPLEDEEWKDPADRDPDRDRRIAKKHLERAYRQATGKKPAP